MKDRFARTALAHELISDINTEKHDAARRAHVKNMHEQRIRQAPHNIRGRNVPRESMEFDPTGGLSPATTHMFTQEHLAFAIAREAAIEADKQPTPTADAAHLDLSVAAGGEPIMMGRQL